MNEKLKFPLKLEDGTIITTIKELEIFFIKREKKINKTLFSGEKDVKSSVLKSYTILSSGLNGYGLDLI